MCLKSSESKVNREPSRYHLFESLSSMNDAEEQTLSVSHTSKY